MENLKKGDVVYLNKVFEKENHIQGGNRPFVIVSNDIGNYFSEICMIVPITTKIRKEIPTHIFIDGTRHTAMCEQIFTIPQDYIERVHHHLNEEEIKQLENGLCVALGVKR